MTSTAFSAPEGIARPQALSWWAWQLSKRDRERDRPGRPRREQKPELRLVKLEPASLGMSSEEAVEIVVGAARVRVTSRSSESALVVALRALGAST